MAITTGVFMNDGTDNGGENGEKNGHTSITENSGEYCEEKRELKTLTEPSLSRKAHQRASSGGRDERRQREAVALGVRGVAPRQARMRKGKREGQGIPQGAPFWGADGGGAAEWRRRGWAGGLRHGAGGRGVVLESPREPPTGGRMGEGAPVRARKGVGRGREGHGDTSPRAPGAA